MMKNNRGLPGPRPRIGIDLHVAQGIFQGSRTHCLELFSRVVAITPEFDFFVFSADSQTLLSFSKSFALPHVTLVDMPKHSASFRLLWQLPRLALEYHLSLLHVQYIAPPVPFCKTAVTIHDILFESHPQYFERSFVLRSRLLMPFSARRSSALLTVSEFSRKALCDTYSIPLSKIHTIHNGVDTTRYVPGRTGHEQVEALGLNPGAYYLSVGRLEPRKNYPALLRAWAQMPVPRPPLVIVGQRHFQCGEIFDLIRSLHLEKSVTGLEEISDTQLPAIYRNARGFVYCSWAEGFGMPLLEAMASGVPVVSAANTALTEVCADAALLINPAHPQEIVDAITRLEANSELRDQLIERGLSRVQQFTWEQSAQTVHGTYSAIVGRY